MPRMRVLLGALAALLVVSAWGETGLAQAQGAVASNPNVTGLWDATASAGSLRIPFRFELQQETGGLTGWLFNGRTRVIASRTTLEGGRLTLRFDQFARELQLARQANGSFAGTYAPLPAGSASADRPAQGRERGRATVYQIEARPWHRPSDRQVHGPSIAGVWLVPAQSRKANEKAWRFIARQSGDEVDAAILRVDGDTGTLSGSWQQGHLLLSNFSGTRAELLEVTPAAQGTLTLTVHDPRQGDTVYTAYRPADAVARGLPGAADAAHHTDVRDRSEPFKFSGNDLSGHTVASSDARFRGKVVLVDVSGSWCPNCHDEAPFLQTLYKRFHSRGLEVVALDFEEQDQLGNPARLRAFVQAYHLGYTVLLDGTPDQVHDRLPQAVDLDAWPTTFFVGRDGRVKAVHTGFAAPASGEFYTRLKAAYTTEIEQLLADKGSG